MLGVNGGALSHQSGDRGGPCSWQALLGQDGRGGQNRGNGRDLRPDRPPQANCGGRVAGAQGRGEAQLVAGGDSEQRREDRQLQREQPSVGRRQGVEGVAGQQDQQGGPGRRQPGDHRQRLAPELVGEGARSPGVGGSDRPQQRSEGADPEGDSEEMRGQKDAGNEPGVPQRVAAKREGRAHGDRPETGGGPRGGPVDDQQRDEGEAGAPDREAGPERAVQHRADQDGVDGPGPCSAGEEARLDRNPDQGRRAGRRGARQGEAADGPRRLAVEPSQPDQDRGASRRGEARCVHQRFHRRGQDREPVRGEGRRPHRRVYRRTSNEKRPFTGWPSVDRPRHAST